MLNVTYAECYLKAPYPECRYAESHYAECHYAECHYAECRGAIILALKPVCGYACLVGVNHCDTSFCKPPRRST